MADFPVESPPKVEDALDKIRIRYDKQNAEDVINHLSTRNNHDFVHAFERLPLILHGYLFAGILSNAGMYRSQCDPNGGAVYFGPRQQFRGYQTGQIVDGVIEAVACLTKNPNDPIYNGVKFYQQFVMVHPFYDANGRIGRFMLETYLNFHNIIMLWRKLYSNEKWLKKLNECHKRFHSGNYNFYLNLLVDHWRRSTSEFRNH